jgi:acyl carrier protein
LQRALLVNQVRTLVADVLGLKTFGVEELQQGFFELGMDSLTSMELRNRLQSTLECTLPAAAVFNYPTVEALVDYLIADVISLDRTAPADVDSHREDPEEEGALTEVKQLTEKELEALIDKEFSTFHVQTRPNVSS